MVSLQGRGVGLEEVETLQSFIACLKATSKRNDGLYCYIEFFYNKTTRETGGLVVYVISRHKELVVELEGRRMVPCHNISII
jgi:hypothetical protein